MGVEHVARLKEIGNTNKILVGKAEGISLLGRCWHRQEDNIKNGIWKIGLECGLDSCGSEWNRWRALVNTVMNFRLHRR